jgi:hypothetical protein
VTLVVADSSILTVNDTTNIDLFWAIRGGGCNFGVVTEFVYQLHLKRRNVYAGQSIFSASVLDKLISVTAEWWANGEGPSEKEAMVQLLTRGPDRNVRPLTDFLKPNLIEFLLLALRRCDCFLQRFRGGRKGYVQTFLRSWYASAWFLYADETNAVRFLQNLLQI